MMYNSNMDLQQGPQQEGNGTNQDNLSLDNQEQTSQRDLNPQEQNQEETACQPTLQGTWRSDFCIKNQENPRNLINANRPRSQGPKVTLIVHTQRQQDQCQKFWFSIALMSKSLFLNKCLARNF